MATYKISYLFGYFIGAAIIGGIIPFIIFLVKKRKGLAVVSLLVCGVAGLIYPIAALIAGVLFLIGAIVTKA